MKHTIESCGPEIVFIACETHDSRLGDIIDFGICDLSIQCKHSRIRAQSYSSERGTGLLSEQLLEIYEDVFSVAK